MRPRTRCYYLQTAGLDSSFLIDRTELFRCRWKQAEGGYAFKWMEQALPEAHAVALFWADPSDTQGWISLGGGSGDNEISMTALCLSGSACEIRLHYFLEWKCSGGSAQRGNDSSFFNGNQALFGGWLKWSASIMQDNRAHSLLFLGEAFVNFAFKVTRSGMTHSFAWLICQYGFPCWSSYVQCCVFHWSV